MDESPNQLADTVGAIDSVVHQTFADQEDIGEVVDKIDNKTDDIPKLRKEFYAFKKDVKKQIASEIKKQMEPVNSKLDRFLETKPKVIYIDFQFPNPLRWFLRVVHRK